MQRFDGIDPAFLWLLNSDADRPDLTVILEADPEVIAERLAARGPHNRFQLTPGSSHAEAHFYRQATERLIQVGFDVLHVDCNQRPAEQTAAFIRDKLVSFSRPPVAGRGDTMMPADRSDRHPRRSVRRPTTYPASNSHSVPMGLPTGSAGPG